MANSPDPIVVDTEGVNKFHGFSVAINGWPEGWYFPIDAPTNNLTTGEADGLKEALYKPDRALIYHNAMHDLEFKKRFGWEWNGPFYDTMLMYHWINEDYYDFSLDAISKLFGFQGKRKPVGMQEWIDEKGWDTVPTDWMTEYSGGTGDAFLTQQIFRKILPRFQEEGFDGPLWEKEQRFIRNAMGPMITLGVKVDLNFCAAEWSKGKKRMEEVKKELGFSPSSPKALEKLFIRELKLPVVKHTKSCKRCAKRESVHTHDGPPSFDKEAMKEYGEMLVVNNDDRAGKVLEFKGWQKTTSSNYEAYIRLNKYGILHPGYKLHGTRTGRLSCADPNLQQIPKSSDKVWNGNLKAAFIPRDGYRLWTVDYSQLQFRMVCAYANEEGLIEIFNDPTRDIFSEMAKDLGWQRDTVKTLVYLTLFGGGAFKAAHAFGITVQRAKVILDRFNARYPGIKRVAAEAQRMAKKQGYIRYFTGRRRHFRAGTPHYRALNAAIQGGEAEIMKTAMLNVAENVADENCRLVLQIHDELALEIRDGMEDHYLPLVQAEMERAPDEFREFIEIDIAFATQAKPWGAK